jgi:toxin YhaV
MVVNGWRLFAHPLFTGQLERLVSQVEALASQTPEAFKNHPATKLLATIRRYMLEIIPTDPNAAEFRQGNTLGPDNRHWFRAKFHDRYRLFYRFSSQEKVIIYAWVNDEDSLRKAEAKTDPYTIFRNMLASGDPPGNMAQLMNISKEMTEKNTGSDASSKERKAKQTARKTP